MNIKYAKLMKKLWKLTGEIGTIAETNEKYGAVYFNLTKAIDAAEHQKLIIYKK